MAEPTGQGTLRHLGSLTTMRLKHGSYSLAGATANNSPISVDYLVVGGGGGASQGGAGAGGARSSWTANSSQTGGGGSAELAASVVSGESCTVMVGAGQPGKNVLYVSGPDGTLSSSFVCVNKDTNCFFGGGSGSAAGGQGVYSGGCGGGKAFATAQGGAGRAGEGFNGGNYDVYGGGNWWSSGGGGAGEQPPVNIAATYSARGGNGIGNSIGDTGNALIYYGGGGGGGAYNGQGALASYAGGTGGGGIGYTNFNTNGGSSATVNSGGGGGGGGSQNPPGTALGGTGSSGIVILRWLTSDATLAIGGGLTYTPLFTNGSYTVAKFTAGSGTVVFTRI